jgi:hypothetical protein
LAVIDTNGDELYQAGIDTVYFSLRRNSHSIQTMVIDSRLGLAIEESDVLRPGAPGVAPGIVLRGEALRLSTIRGGAPLGDDLDALDLVLAAGVPIANPDTAGFNPDGAVLIDVLENDAAMRGQLVPSSVMIVVPPGFGTASVDETTGEVTYVATDESAPGDSFGYVVFDSNDQVSETAVVLLERDAVAVTEPTDRPSMLSPAGPNPFRASTQFAVRTVLGGPARVDVFGPSGNKVRALLNEDLDKGESRMVHWDGRNDQGKPVAPGVYLVRLTSPEGSMQIQVVRSLP